MWCHKFKIKVHMVCLCILVVLIVFARWGTPWGYMACQMRIQRYIAEQFTEANTINFSVTYDHRYQTYRAFCRDQIHGFSFSVWGSPYVGEMNTDYMFRYWENSITSMYAKKYPMYELLPIISVEYIWMDKWPPPQSYDIFEYEAFMELPIHVAVYTNENIESGYSDSMRALLVDLYNDFGMLKSFDVEIYHSSGQSHLLPPDLLAFQ